MSAEAGSSSDAAVNAAQGYQFPNGHLGHLSAQQQEKFEAFKKLCEERGRYTTTREKDGLPSRSDQTLLRYLRARKFELEPAYKQFTDAEDWRAENKLEELYDTIDVQEYDETRRLYPQWVGSRDKRGMPVYLFEVAPLNSKAITAYEQAKTLKGASMDTRNASPKLLRLFALYENLTRFATPWCSALDDRPYHPTPITQGCNIIDIKGTGLKQFWDLKSHLQDSSQLATAYYPETLDKIFIIGAPSFFPTVWSWVKRWFDPVVVSKMFVLSQGEVLKVLSEHIDPENIPQKYGGGLEWNWGDMPNLTPSTLKDWTWENGYTQLPIGTVRWEKGEKGEMVCIAVGTEEGKERHKVVGRLNKSWEETFYPFLNRKGGKEAATEEGKTAPVEDRSKSAEDKPQPTEDKAKSAEGERAQLAPGHTSAKEGDEAAPRPSGEVTVEPNGIPTIATTAGPPVDARHG